MDSGFHVCGFRIPHPWIPDSITTDWIPATWILDYNGWIPDSISWIPDSGLPYMGRQVSSRHGLGKNATQIYKNERRTCKVCKTTFSLFNMQICDVLVDIVIVVPSALKKKITKMPQHKTRIKKKHTV